MRKVLFQTQAVNHRRCLIQFATSRQRLLLTKLSRQSLARHRPTRPIPTQRIHHHLKNGFSAQSLQNGDRFQIRTSEDINMQNIQTPIDGKSVFEVIMFIARIFQGVSRKFLNCTLLNSCSPTSCWPIQGPAHGLLQNWSY